MADASTHDRVEEGFRTLGQMICARPWRVLGLTLLITAALAAFLPTLWTDFSNDSYLLPGDDARERFDAFRDQFGLDDRTVVALEPDDVFDLEFLAKLRDLHRRIEEIPRVEEVMSLINARVTRGERDELIVEELMEEWPESEADLAALRERVLSNPTYRDALISDDARYTVILVRMDTYSTLGASDEALDGFDGDADPGLEPGKQVRHPEYLTGRENNWVVDALYELVGEFESEDLTIRLAGEGVIGQRASELSTEDSAVFFGLSIGMIAIVMFALFRRISAPLLPIAVVLTSMVATFGAMAMLNIPFSFPTQILPTFLIAVGVCDSVHILTIFFQAWDRGEAREACVVEALVHSGFAVVLTSLTTAAGLLSFLSAEIAPVARLGTIAPIGVLLTLFYTLTMLPALLVLVPIRPARSVAGGRGLDTRREPGRLTALLMDLGDRMAANPRIVVAAAALVVLAATPGVVKVRFSHDPTAWLLPDDPVRVAVERMDEALKGVSVVEVLIDTGRENGLHDPEVLRRIEAAAAFAESLTEGPVPVGKATSIIDILKEINQALNANEPGAYRVPDERQLIAQELLLFENSGSDDLSQVTDTPFRTARMTLKVPLVDGFHYGPFLAELAEGLRKALGPELAFEMTGSTVLGNRAFTVVVVSMVRSYALALAIITPLMIFMIGSLRLGLVSMIPNLVPVYLTLALMGWWDIPLTISTLMVGSIVIGLAVDDTIHFLHNFDRYFRATGSARVAVARTLETTGVAMLTTSVVLAASFGIFCAGRMTGIVQFGVLASAGVVTAFLADILLSPALVTLVRGKR